MRKTDPSLLISGMLRDIGLSGSRQQTGDDRGAALMRLSGDPLQLHDHLCRREREAAPPSRPLVPPGLLMAGLAPGGLATPPPFPAGCEPANFESLRPESFAPTEDDRRYAIDETGGHAALPVSPVRFAPAGLLALATAVFVVALLLIP